MIKPGELTRAEADELNELISDYRELVNALTASARLPLQRVGGRLSIGLVVDEGFWAEVVSGTNPYVVNKKLPDAGGTWGDGQTLQGVTAYEANMRADVVAGDIVWVERGYVDSTEQQYVFTLAAATDGTGNHNLLSATHPDTVPASVVAGDIVRGNTTPKWERYAIGTSGQVLAVQSGLPTWTDLSTLLGPVVAHTLLNSTYHTDTVDHSPPNNGDMIYGASNLWQPLALGTAFQGLHSNGTAPFWASQTLLSQFHTDTEPNTVVVGAMIYGSTVPKWDMLLRGEEASTLIMSSDGDDRVPAWEEVTLLHTTHVDTDPVVPAQGDMIFRDSGLWTVFNIGTQNQTLIVSSPLNPGPVWTSVTLLHASHTDTDPAAVQVGDLIRGNTVGMASKWQRYAIGSSADFLRVRGGLPTWDPPGGTFNIVVCTPDGFVTIYFKEGLGKLTPWS